MSVLMGFLFPLSFIHFCLFLVYLYLTLLQTSSKTISKLAHPNAPLGYGLCFLNLAFDGFTNATQDSITARYLNWKYILVCRRARKVSSVILL